MTEAAGFEWISEPWGPALRSPAAAGSAMHLFTTRQLRLRGPAEEQEWALVAKALGVAAHRLVRLNQVHGSDVAVFRRGDDIPSAPVGWPHADILLTDDPSIALAVQVADCVPLLLADRERRAVAAVHAGWRGSCAGAASKAVQSMREVFGVSPDSLRAIQGPSIGPCCYEVGPEVLEAFAAAHAGEQVRRWFGRDAAGRLILDLWRGNAEQLQAAGVPADAIHVASLCTACRSDLFHSYRRDGPGTGRVAGAIRLEASGN